MALTIQTAQAQVARRLGEYAGLVDLVDLVAIGVRSLGVVQADLSVLVDDDLSTVTSAQLSQFYDVAQAEGLELILANLDPLRLRSIGIEEDPDKIATRLRAILVALRLRIKESYGVGLQPLVGGIWNEDIVQRGDERCSGEFG